MNCSSCGTENPVGNRFCSSCGSALSPPAETFCAHCHSPLAAGLRFCGSCGAPTAHQTVAGTVPRYPGTEMAPSGSIGSWIVPALRAINQDPSGAAALVVVFILGSILSWVGWVPLSLPTRSINAIVPQGTCTNVIAGSFEMYLCSAKVAALTQVGPILVMVALVLARKSIGRWLRWLTPKVPQESHFLLAPLVATALFAAVWGAVHDTSYAASGILPQTVFPAIVGVFTFATARFGPGLQRTLRPVFDLRDKLPRWLRVVGAIGVPLVLSLMITAQQRVSQEALKEQFIVLVSLCTSYLVLAPRSGSLLSGVQQAIQRRR